MELVFNLTDCFTKFIANDKVKRSEIIFNARPNAFTITQKSGVLISQTTEKNEEGAQIELAIVAENFDGNVIGFLDEFDGWGLNIALSCTELQMSHLQNFLINGKIPTQIKIQLDDVALVNRNIKLEKSKYTIASWNFQI